MVPVGDSERVHQVVELADDTVDRPEIRAAHRVVRAPAVADLVVEDDRAAVLHEVGEREQIVVRRAWTAVEGDERGGRIGVVRAEVTVDSEPGLGDVTVEAKRGISFLHRRKRYSAATRSHKFKLRLTLAS